MRQTDQTLLEQMRISEFDIERRKALLALTEEDFSCLRDLQGIIEARIDVLVDQFYELQTTVPEIGLLIGDADTLSRLRSAQRKYVLDLFSGVYDLEYVNNRLRIGLVHKRIGVEPKLYLSAVNTLKSLLVNTITEAVEDPDERIKVLLALQRLFMFDITLVFETYIRSLVTEIEISREKVELYAQSLETKVKERTRQLEEMTRIDALTGLQNVRFLADTLAHDLRAAQRRSEPVTLVYIDVDDFKLINDSMGHQYGDEVLRKLGAAIRSVSRIEDHCFRYGGDEFCVILPNCTEAQAQDVYWRRLTLLLERTATVTDVSLSIGIAQTGPDSFVEAEELIHEADQRMYSTKKANKENRQDQETSPT